MTKEELETDLTDLDKASTMPIEESNRVIHEKNETEPMTNKIKRYCAATINFFTVEPFLLCYLLPSVISSLAVQKLNLEKACRSDLHYSEDFCSRMISGDIKEGDPTDGIDGSQRLVAEMTLWTQPIQSGIPALVILFVGAWSDRTGNRKALMLIPILGELVSSILLMLSAYFFLDWPLWVTGLIEVLPSALTGGWSIALMGSYSYIADVTAIEERTFRIGVVAVIVTLGIPIGSSISGVLTEAIGYYGIFGTGMTLYLIGFVYTFYKIHDVNKIENDVEKTVLERITEFFHVRNAWDTLSILFNNKVKNRVRQIWLVVLAHVVIVGPVFGEGSVMFLYTLKKFSMDVVDFSLFSTYSVTMGLVGTIVAVSVFSKYMGMHDAFIGIIATACKVLSSFVYAFATTRNWFYLGPVVDFFGNSGVTAIRSLGTKVVDPDEVGKMCSLIGLAEALVPVVYAPLYSQVYADTLDYFPGAFYVVGGVMTVPAFFIFITMYVIYRREQRDIVQDPKSKELYARNNEITAL